MTVHRRCVNLHKPLQAKSLRPKWMATRCGSMAILLIDDGIAGNYPDYSGAEQATMALGSLINTMNKPVTSKMLRQ